MRGGRLKHSLVCDVKVARTTTIRQSVKRRETDFAPVEIMCMFRIEIVHALGMR